MRMLCCSLLLGFFLIPLSAHAQSADDYWPSWRGPLHNGVAPNAQPPLTWSEEENIQWKVNLPGHGSSTPIIWGNKLILLAAIETDKPPVDDAEIEKETPAPQDGGRRGGPPRGPEPEHLYQFDVLCLDRSNGKTLWQQTVREAFPHESHHPHHGYASYSPVTDGQYIWVNFGSRGVHCLDMDGNVQWSTDLGTLQTHRSFGESSSPVLAGNALIVQMDHNGASKIVALNKTTGENLWEEARDEATTWTSPLCVEVEGKLQIVTNATNFVRCYDAVTGAVIWKSSGQTRNVIPVPVAGFGNVYCTSGFRGAMLQAIELGHTGDLNGTEAILWEATDIAPYVPSPLLYGENLYIGSGIKATLSCYNALDGTPGFTDQDMEGLKGMYASPVGAANRVYCVSRDGVTKVIENSPEYNELATNVLEDEIDASPAMVGNTIYLRGKQFLYCIAE